QLASVNPGDSILDVACGTGDLARAFAEANLCDVVGVDFAADMLRHAQQRQGADSTPSLPSGSGTASPLMWCRSDALQLPFRDESFRIASCAFGVRNFQNLCAGLREMHRVLKPGGRAVILKFSMPRGKLMRRLYDFYLASI